nr:GSCFA domain-containing protein [uncultured Cohaesibacter sp.]
MNEADKYFVWSRGLEPKWETEGHAEFDAATRLLNADFVDIYHEPKFKLSPQSSYFMIGSCFARNMEHILSASGKNVLSAKLDLPEDVAQAVGASTTVLTKFTTNSMLTELKMVLEGLEFPDYGLIELSEGKFWNPQLHKIGALERSRAVEVHQLVHNTIETIKDADVVLITLGLTEEWWDTVLDVPLNGTPIDWRFAKKTGRFEFRNSGFDENRQRVEELVNIIKTHSNRDVRVVLTVSPVPLQRTFSKTDIIVANSYSKSVLRSAAQEVSSKYDWVDYYPSFEMVMYSPRAESWRHDQRHVRYEQVQKILQKFHSIYIEEGLPGDE